MRIWCFSPSLPLTLDLPLNIFSQDTGAHSGFWKGGVSGLLLTLNTQHIRTHTHNRSLQACQPVVAKIRDNIFQKEMFKILNKRMKNMILNIQKVHTFCPEAKKISWIAYIIFFQRGFGVVTPKKIRKNWPLKCLF